MVLELWCQCWEVVMAMWMSCEDNEAKYLAERLVSKIL